MKTGVRNMNSNVRPKFYLDKYYPIKGRKDFFKYFIQTPEGIAKDFEGNEMYFDVFDLWRAKEVLKAKRRVDEMNIKHMLN